MKCLQICNGLWGSKVHRNLYQKLDELQIPQIIFSPLRENRGPGDKPAVQFSVPDSKIIGSRILKLYHRIFFRYKVKSLYSDLKEQVALNKVSLAHATTLFSDGAIALKIYQEYKIPYIVAVRATDINIFFRYRPDLFFLVHRILKHARCIIFMSDALQDNFYSHSFMQAVQDKYIPKSVVINNGIDSFWLSNKRGLQKMEGKPHKILYVGRLIERKNLLRLIEAISSLKMNYQKLQFNIVGANGEQKDEIKKISSQYKWITFHGPIYDKNELLKMYRANHIFAMPSINETFGLVYIEALSQGLPILYTKGDGIDGVITKKVGQTVDPLSVESICGGIENILNNYNSYEIEEINFNNFDWLEIAKKYRSLYQKVSFG